MRNLILVLTIVCALPSLVFAAPTSMQKLASQGVKDVPTDQQIAADYDGRTDGQPVYLGFALRTAATSDSVWIIYKFTYDGSDQMTTRKVAYGIWDNRASLTYQ